MVVSEPICVWNKRVKTIPALHFSKITPTRSKITLLFSLFSIPHHSLFVLFRVSVYYGERRQSHYALENLGIKYLVERNPSN